MYGQQQGLKALFSIVDAIFGNFVLRSGKIVAANSVSMLCSEEYENACEELLSVIKALHEKHAALREKNLDSWIGY